MSSEKPNNLMSGLWIVLSNTVTTVSYNWVVFFTAFA